MFGFIIVCVIIVAIIVAIEYRYYILYFFNLLDVTNKNRKNLKDVQNEGINKRYLEDDDVIEYRDLSRRLLKSNNLWDKKTTYVLDKGLEKRLRYSKYSEDNVQKLFNDITSYMNLDSSKMTLKVVYQTGRYLNPYAGLYNEDIDNKDFCNIEIIITSDTKIEELVSVIAHESTHHLLLSHGIKLRDRMSNECLTDITAVVLGFGKYMEKGYQITNRVLYDREYTRTVTKDRIGYLSSNDIRYLLSKL